MRSEQETQENAELNLVNRNTGAAAGKPTH